VEFIFVIIIIIYDRITHSSFFKFKIKKLIKHMRFIRLINYEYNDESLKNLPNTDVYIYLAM